MNDDPAQADDQAPVIGEKDRAAERIARWKAVPADGDRTRRHSIDLFFLGLTSVPEAIRELEGLEFLDLTGNRIRELPTWIGQLRRLREIGLSANLLRDLPAEMGELQRLEVLYLLDNELERLPSSLLQLPQLQQLWLDGNPRLEIPHSLLQTRRAREILRYYVEARTGRPLSEVKLLLVGRGKSGKTTLVKRLAGEQPKENESETHSIVIRELSFNCLRGRVRTRAWDFGGQEILHATHQFFLTERSLYLLVLEPRTGLAQRDAEYWLKLIDAQGAGSPVIIVLNWSYDRRWRVDEVKLRRKFPNVVGFVSTDALQGVGFEELQALIIQTVENSMSEVWLPFPARWREIKDAVAGMRENFLTYQQYVALCESHGENRPDAQADLAGILHALGLALYFGKDPRLHDTRVLNPSWVTGGVYAVIRSPSVAQNSGQLAVTDMPRVLREAEVQRTIMVKDYPPDAHRFILDLMRAFQLCYASEEENGQPTRYLVPELLPEFEPEMAEPWETAQVRLRYRYDVLPPGLMPRFIVRTHALSDGAPHWRHGVVLRHAEAKALIRAESDRPELHVFVLAPDDDTRQLLTAIVRRELETLHLEMKVHPSEELELSGSGERWIGVRALREVERQAEKPRPIQILPVQPDGVVEVDVSQELDKLVPASVRVRERQHSSDEQVIIRLFVSYAHDDERQLKRLDAILDVLEQQHGLTSWRDRRLIPGDEWDERIRDRLEEMDIFLFVASQGSLRRPYIRSRELKRAKERHETGEIEVVVVKLEPCASDEDSFLGKFQGLPRNYKSIVQAQPRSAGWEDVRQDLLPLINRVLEKKKTRAGG